jgi:carboxymethylenebutenolidase
MNNKILQIIILILVVIGGVYLWNTNRAVAPAEDIVVDTTQSENIKNAEMLETENNTPIVTETDVAYFAGAKGYFVKPESVGNYPGVILIHENRGLRPEIKATAEQLAKEGYSVLAVDLFEGVVMETQDEARAFTASFDQAKGLENLKAAVKFLKDAGSSKVASLGWCFGGGQSLQLALSGEQMDATVIYYGRLATTTEALAPIDWPVLGIFGGTDQSISVESVNQFNAALEANSISKEIHIYPGVGHAFANPSGMNYAANETKDAWAKTVAFLRANLK